MKKTTMYLPLVLLIGVGASLCVACDDSCGTIQQIVEVAEPDTELAALLTDCKEGRVSPQAQCPASQSDTLGESQVSCACRPLCERMMALVDGFPGPETLKSCLLFSGISHNRSYMSIDAGLPLGPNAFQVSLSYVPSNCHAPAQ